MAKSDRVAISDCTAPHGHSRASAVEGRRYAIDAVAARNAKRSQMVANVGMRVEDHVWCIVSIAENEEEMANRGKSARRR